MISIHEYAGSFSPLIEFTWDYPVNEEDRNSTIMLRLRDCVGQPSIPSKQKPTWERGFIFNPTPHRGAMM